MNKRLACKSDYNLSPLTYFYAAFVVLPILNLFASNRLLRIILDFFCYIGKKENIFYILFEFLKIKNYLMYLQCLTKV